MDENAKKLSDWVNMLSQPYSNAARKLLFDLLKNRCLNHELIVDLICRQIVSAKDYENFGKFVAEIYEAGYFRAIEEHESELKKAGLKVVLKKMETNTEAKEKHPLF